MRLGKQHVVLSAAYPRSFPPRCEEVADCGSTEVNSRCRCSGMWGPYDLLIVDTLQVSSDIYIMIP